ncbi:MAG: dehydrogenase E1 component subunit alpha/beta [Flammeovirgaceae bacterium]|nr:dehydrogenase E1 component subunit alpha/beta [Flammeovirgaceae bacterium]
MPEINQYNAILFERKNYSGESHSDETLIEFYKALIKPRLIEEKMLILLRQGKITKWFSGIGQEAISVGVGLALDLKEYILPMHRNLGAFTTRNISLAKLFAQFQGKKSGFTRGRDRSFHFGSKEHHIVGMISHLGPQLSIANGIALANKLENNQQVTLAFSGDGATSQGEFHEALNVAAVWDLPVIFLVENNGYGLSTPNNEQFRCASISDKAIGYGMEAMQVDGNNILEVISTIKKAKAKAISESRPILVEALTFRMRGHEEASGTKYVPIELMKEWQAKDPVQNYEAFLQGNQIITEKEITKLKSQIKKEIDNALAIAFQEALTENSIENELKDLFAPTHVLKENSLPEKKSKIRFVDAISKGLYQAMEKFPNLILMGQDIAEYGGVFKITEGFLKKFGKERVRNTPLCESAIIGAGLGLSVKGYKTMVEMQFADFVTCGFNQIINNLAKSHYRWGQNADVVVRMPTGAGVKAGPYHSQSNEAWFTHTPGLKVVYPSSPSNAKGLLTAAFEDPNPVLYFEHKALYRSISEEVPEEYYTLPIGKASVVTQGKDISIITYGMGVHWAKEILAELPEISAEIIDLRTLLPWDKDAVKTSLMKTNKVLVCNEDCLTGSLSGEIAAWIAENCFEFLDAPVMREGSLDTPVPFAAKLENQFLPKERIREKILKLMAY